MTEQVEQEVNEPTANPYNKDKSWHTPDAPNRGSADSLFFDDSQQATSEEAPVEEEAPKKTRTNYKKRYDDLKKHYDEKMSEFKQREQELRATPAELNYAPPKTLEDLEQFKQQYPDLYDTVETVAHLQSQQETEGLRQKLSTLEEKEAEITRREAETTLKQAHPDYEELRQSQDFHGWAEMQPEEIQKWIYQNPDNVNLAVKAIDLYKLEAGIKTKSSKSNSSKSQSSGSAADMVSTRTTSIDSKEPKIWTRKEINSLSMADYDKYEQEIDLAVSEGRVVS